MNTGTKPQGYTFAESCVIFVVFSTETLTRTARRRRRSLASRPPSSMPLPIPAHPHANGTEPSYGWPIVVLFMHVAKCGGSSVRAIFQQQGWKMTHWSLVEREEGWHDHRTTRSIGGALADEARRGKRPRIFAEWHLGLNWTVLPSFEQNVQLMWPGAIYHSFTIFRPPTEMVASNGAYWSWKIPAELFLYTRTEFLLFGVLGMPVLPESARNGTAICESSDQAWAVCTRIAGYDASLRKRNVSASLHIAHVQVGAMSSRRATLNSTG